MQQCITSRQKGGEGEGVGPTFDSAVISFVEEDLEPFLTDAGPDWVKLGSVKKGTKLQRMLTTFGYSNVIKSPTKITKNSRSLIDLSITSPNLGCIQSGSLDPGTSDHHLLCGVFALVKSKPKPKIFSVKNYKSLDINELKVEMDRAP